MGQEGRESEMREDGRLDALVQKKALLLGRYLSITQEMMDCLGKNQAEALGALLARRRKCMEDVDKTDILLQEAAKEQADKGSMEKDHARIRAILLRIEALEQELMSRMRKEAETLKEELLKMRTARGAVDKYRGYAGEAPRFLDVKNQ